MMTSGLPSMSVTLPVRTQSSPRLFAVRSGTRNFSGGNDAFHIDLWMLDDG